MDNFGANALWTFPNLFLMFNLLLVRTAPLVLYSLIFFASVQKFPVPCQQLQPPFNMDVLDSYPSQLITRCYLNKTTNSWR
jgi:hypothetical protein